MVGTARAAPVEMGIVSERPVTAPVARRVGWIVAAGLLAITAFGVAKYFAMGGLAEAEIAAGEAAIARAVSGDEGAFEEARESFRDAASVSVLDYYPAFGLSATDRLEQLHAGETAGGPDPASGDPVLSAMLANDWEGARRAVDEMRDAEPGRAAYYDRLVEAVRQSSMKAE